MIPAMVAESVFSLCSDEVAVLSEFYHLCAFSFYWHDLHHADLVCAGFVLARIFSLVQGFISIIDQGDYVVIAFFCAECAANVQAVGCEPHRGEASHTSALLCVNLIIIKLAC